MGALLKNTSSLPVQRRSLILAAALSVVLGGLLANYLQSHSNGIRHATSQRDMRDSRDPSRPLTPPGAPLIKPVTYEPIAPQTAAEINATVPIESVGPGAAPFHLTIGTPTWDRAINCLAQAVYYEARTETLEGQQAVAQVVLNRVRSPAFPASICEVVYEGSERPTGCQFTFTCDGSRSREPGGGSWQRAYRIAGAALNGAVYKPVGYATHYHANYVVPYWASSMAKVRVIGAHDFYRWPGRWRAANYFSQAYANSEPNLGQVSAATDALTDQLKTPSAQSMAETRFAADSVFAIKNKMTALVIDHSKQSSLIEDHAAVLNPRLNHYAAPNADFQSGKLAPK